jgi:polysaccharide export outer membrane protein
MTDVRIDRFENNRCPNDGCIDTPRCNATIFNRPLTFGTAMITMQRLACLPALLVLAACAQNETVPIEVAPPPAVATIAEATPDTTTSYVIGAGDQLQVFVYDAPQLSTEVPVRPDGRISTPLVPELVAAGKTPKQLSQDLAARLKEYVNDPNVTVIVRNFVGPFSRQIRVIGEAAEPQAISYRDGMTVLDVMIVTKGLTRYAAGNRAMIVRKENGRQESVRVRLSDLLKDGDISQNVEMKAGDTLIIPQSWF